MLLANLLHTLSAEEIAKVRADFRLPERSRLVFERIAGSAKMPPDAKSLAKAFRISTENLYRLFSEIVDECVRILAPKEEFATMKFFRGKYLYRPFVTEMHRTEKRLLAERERSVLEKFYEFSFFNLREFPIDLLDLDLADAYAKKWHQSKVNPPPEDDLYIRLQIIYLRICAFPSRKKMTLEQMSAASRALLDPVAPQARTTVNMLARYSYFQAEWKACIYERDNAEARITWVERMLETVRNARGLFPPGTEQTYELLLAFENATTLGKVQDGLETFRKYYNGQTPDTSRGALFLKRYAQLAFLAKDFETSRKMVEVLEGYQFVRTTPSIYIMVLIIKTMLDLIENSPGCASETIAIAKEVLRDNFFLASEVQIRGLEAATAFMRGDLAQAEQFAERNIKWLRSRRISLSASAWIYYYQIIGNLVRFRITGEPIRNGLLDHFKNDFRAEHPDFFILLENEIEIAKES